MIMILTLIVCVFTGLRSFTYVFIHQTFAVCLLFQLSLVYSVKVTIRQSLCFFYGYHLLAGVLLDHLSAIIQLWSGVIGPERW